MVIWFSVSIHLYPINVNILLEFFPVAFSSFLINKYFHTSINIVQSPVYKLTRID